SFWKQPLQLIGRTLWYRFIHKKLHYQQTLAKIREPYSATCLLCSTQDETLDHFLIPCPRI
ncbi:hypothetical protein BC941DRAFT_361835, partial [Chlamydoabsidia padenii]